MTARRFCTECTVVACIILILHLVLVHGNKQKRDKKVCGSVLDDKEGWVLQFISGGYGISLIYMHGIRRGRGGGGVRNNKKTNGRT